MIKTPLSTMIGGAFWTPNCTILGGASKTLNQLIKSLFANNEQGFAYDPNDLSTMFQDAAGTIPVTGAGQPVGLILDKSKGLVLSSELVKNGDFSDGSTDWNLEATWVLSNNATIATNAPAGTSTYQNLTTTLGRFYKITFTVSNYIAGSVFPTLFNGDNGAVVSSNGTFSSIVLKRNAGLSAIGIASRDSFSGTIDNISVKEIAGNHAYQTTSSMRPLLVASPQRLDYDTVDDKLTTTLPAQLTGCTVVRAVPNVGTQILTNQTIPTPYNDNIDNCGLIVINRALTASETSQITKLFNKAAGV